MPDIAFDMPPVSAGFDARGGWLLLRLMADLSLTPEQAAGIVGTLGAESGLQAIQEKKPASGRGGFGWAQWTGARRVEFEKFCADHDKNVTNDEANYLFLIGELRGRYAHALEQLEKCTAVDSAVYTFVTYFEKPSAPDAETKRAIPMAKRALIAAGKAPVAVVWTPPQNWPQPLEPAPWPPQKLPVAPAPSVMPPIANGAVAGGLTLLSMMFVQQAVFAFGLLHVVVPENLQNLTTGGLVVLIGWFLHTRLAKALKLDQG